MKLSTVFAAGLLVSSVGCKKKEAAAPDPTPKTATDPTGSGSAGAGAGSAGAGSGSAAATPPKALTGDDIAKRYVECWGFFSAKDWKKFEGCYAAGVTSDNVDSGLPPVTGWAEILAKHDQPIVDAMPDIKGDVELTLINGHNGATVALMSGTHSGTLKTPMGDVPATNKKFGLQVAHAVHFTEDGNTVDKEWFYQDGGVLMAQLGLSPAPARAAIDKPWGANEVVVAKDDATEKANMEAFNKLGEAFNKHNVKDMGALFADDLVWSETGIPKDWNKKEALDSHGDLFKAFSDLKITTTTAWAAGDYVVQQAVFAGTNDGDAKAMGFKKTGKPMSLNFLQVFKFKDGKLTRSWGFWNSAAFAHQLGLDAKPGDKDGKPADKGGKPADKTPAKK